MKMDKKKMITYIVIAVIVVAVIVTGVIIAVNNNKSAKTEDSTATIETVNDSRSKAEEARAANNPTEAKALLEEAQAQIKELPVTDETTNARVDVEAQLYLLEHADEITN